MSNQFKQGVVFELEKDNNFYNSQSFKKVIEKKYGFTPETKLYLDIVNYQVANYGTTLNARDGSKPRFMSARSRQNKRDYERSRWEEKKVIERAEENERKNMVHTRKTS